MECSPNIDRSVAFIVSYHNYSPYADNIEIIAELKNLGRPIINSEWLCRPAHNTVEEMFPLFFLEKIGCYNRGFVAGKFRHTNLVTQPGMPIKAIRQWILL